MHQLPALAFKYHATLASLRAFRRVSKGLLVGTAEAGGILQGLQRVVDGWADVAAAHRLLRAEIELLARTFLFAP